MLVEDIPLTAIDFAVPQFDDSGNKLRFEALVAARADNIRAVGLLQPVLVRRTGGRCRLVAGRQRLLAYDLLRAQHPDDPRWQAIPCHIYTDEQVRDALLAVSENSQRADPPLSAEITQAVQSLPPSDQLAFLADVRRQMEDAARGRQRAGKADEDGDRGKTAAKLARLIGRSPAWVERCTALVKAAEEDPEHFGKFKDQMDARGRCYAAYERMLDMRRALELRAEPVVSHPQVGQFVHGDCLDILRGLPDHSWDHGISDVPFGLGKVFDGWAEPGHSAETYWRWFEPHLKELYRVVRPGGLIALFQSFLYRRHFAEWFGSYGYTDLNEMFVCKSSVDYRKNNRNKRRRSETGSHHCPLILAIDPVVMLWKAGDRLKLPLEWAGRRRENWVPTRMDVDPVGKLFEYTNPVALMEEIIFRWCREGSSILDPFCGSGAMCIAADRRGHPWMGIERSESTCQLAAKRLQWHRENNARPDNNDWSTEQEFWEGLRRAFDFTVDAAASAANAKLPRYWTREDDALRQDWSGETVWCNPPFDDPEPFLEKARTARSCCAIVPATCLTTRYFRGVRPDYLALPDRRVHFDPAAGHRRPAQNALWGYPLLIYGSVSDSQLAALESMRLAVFPGLPHALRRA